MLKTQPGLACFSGNTADQSILEEGLKHSHLGYRGVASPIRKTRGPDFMGTGEG